MLLKERLTETCRLGAVENQVRQKLGRGLVAQDGLDIQLPTGSHDESPCVFKIQFAPAHP